MAALNFPDNPNVNDVFTAGAREWIWDGSVWVSNSGRENTRRISANAPADPIEGDEWYESDTGKLYIYFNDNWVQQLGFNPTKSIRSESANTALVSGDANQVIRFTGTSSQVLTVDDVLEVGDRVEVIQDNSGSVEFSSGSGVNLLSDNGEFGSSGQNTKVEIMCVAFGEYRLYGDLVEAVSSIEATGGTLTDVGGYRYHTFTSTGTFEVTAAPQDASVEYLVLSGGGGGGGASSAAAISNGGAGGGGAGGLVFGSTTITDNTYSVTVGAGGGGGDTSNNGTKGGSSSFASFASAEGGGYGAGGENLAGGNGACGGGGSENSGGTGSIGFNGGNSSGSNPYGGGGGGMGQAGTASTDQDALGTGGDGIDTYSAWASATSTGAAGYYAGGGGGGMGKGGGDVAPGGQGGGGDGANESLDAVAGTANTGGGGGGGKDISTSVRFGANGGSGVVIIRYPI